MQKAGNMDQLIKKLKSSTARAAVLAASLALLTGCGKDADYGKYVTLGEYRGLSVEYAVDPVTEEELAEYEQENVEVYAEYRETDGPLQEGMVAGVLLTATETGGELIYDFSEDGYDMVIGDGEFDAPVDEALLGAKAGDTLDLTVTHTDEFTDMALSGRTVDYHIEVQTVSEVIIPEVTDAFVKENFGAATVAEWHEANRAELLSEHEDEADGQYRDALVDEVIKGSEISGYPKSLYESKKEAVDSEYQGYLDMFDSDMTLTELYEMLGTSEDEVTQQYLDETNRAMVLALIREKEGIEFEQDAWEAWLSEYAASQEYDTTEELLADYDEASLREYYLDEQTVDLLVSCAASK